MDEIHFNSIQQFNDYYGFETLHPLVSVVRYDKQCGGTRPERIKATVASTMYDMSKVTVEGYFASENTPAQRMEKRKAIAAQRTIDYKAGSYKRAGGVIDPLPDDAPWFVKDYYDYYKTPRGYHKRSGNSNDGWNVIGCQSFLNQPLLCYANEISTPVLLIHGEKAHSRYFSEYAFEKMTGKNATGKA